MDYDPDNIMNIHIDDYGVEKYIIHNYYDEETIKFDIDDVTKYIKDYFEFFYDVYKSVNGLDLDIFLIPVLDTDKYSDFIYEVITKIKDPENISKLKHIAEYLNEETKDKLEHIINANKFDLI